MSTTATTSAPAAPAGTDHDRADARLRLKPDGPITGYVDGAWWPRSGDLAAEVPALAAAVGDRVGPVERVSYHFTDWVAECREIDVSGSRLRLGGFRMQHPHTVDVIGRNRRLTLLVIPPETAPEAAEEVLAKASQPGDRETVDDLLGGGTDAPPEFVRPRESATADARGEGEGGTPFAK
ncbi:MAG TPA: DUF5994 family protein [Pseudonocardia sp.]|nr:DUF5994 family protein [Pseudonocardia sp.]